MHCLKFCSVISNLMLKVFPPGMNKGSETFVPLVNCTANNVLLHSSPDISQPPLQIVHAMNFLLVDYLYIVAQIRQSTGF